MKRKQKNPFVSKDEHMEFLYKVSAVLEGFAEDVEQQAADYDDIDDDDFDEFYKDEYAEAKRNYIAAIVKRLTDDLTLIDDLTIDE